MFMTVFQGENQTVLKCYHITKEIKPSCIHSSLDRLTENVDTVFSVQYQTYIQLKMDFLM